MDTEQFIGQQIDRYIIVNHIARGGMADVYLAEDIDLKRKVALKVMLEMLAADPQFVQRFRREAQTVAQLDHPNIVQVYSTGLTPSKQPYIAMQFIEGGSLQEKLEQLDARGKLLTTEQALNITRQLALALGVAHDAHIVHRDLKPSNVLIRPDGTPVLVDLGIVAVRGGDKLTQTGSLIGTPSYMSPDQVRGLPLDGRSDLYSLGIILYEMLSGTRPFMAEEPIAVLHKQVYEEHVSLQRRRPDLSPATIKIVDTCLKKDPEERYKNAEELVQAIDQAIQAEGASGPDPRAIQVLTHLHDSSLISRQQFVRVPTEEHYPQPYPPRSRPQPRPQPVPQPSDRRTVPPWVIVTLLVIVAVVALVLGMELFGGDEVTPIASTVSLPPTDTPPPVVAEVVTQTVIIEVPVTTTIEPTTPPTDTPEPTATGTQPPTNTPEPTPTEDTSTLPQTLIGQDGLEMRLVPAGEFIMGSTSSEVDQAVSMCRQNPDGDLCARTEFTSEMPQHLVFISDFYMDVTEITNDQYRTCVSAGACDPPDPGSGRYRRSEYYDRPQFGDYPVVWVSWFDAQDYCAWAGERLPTEAEWEKAARGEDGRVYPWGNEFSNDRANTQDRGTEVIFQVGQFPTGASIYGIQDLAGNVWEYVADWLDPNYYFDSTDRDPQGPASSPTGMRVLRSGSYANFKHYARAANRGAVTPDSSTQFRGIRCVMDAP